MMNNIPEQAANYARNLYPEVEKVEATTTETLFENAVRDYKAGAHSRDKEVNELASEMWHLKRVIKSLQSEIKYNQP